MRREDIDDADTVEGIPEAQAVITPWLKKIVDSSDNEAPLVIKLVQVPKHSNGGELSLEQFPYAFEDPVEELVQEILERAIEDAHGTPGRSNYAIRVMGREQRKKFHLLMPMREVGGGEDDEWGTSFLPEHKGIIGQQMEHNQVFAKELVAATREGRQDARQIIQDLRAENAQLKREAAETRRERREELKRAEELRSLEFMRKREQRKLDRSEEREEKIISGLMTVGPPLLMAALGGEKATARMAMLQQANAGPAGSGDGAAGGAGAPTEEQLIDALIIMLEKRPAKQQAVFSAIMDEPDILRVFGEISRRSGIRRAEQEKAAQKEAETKKTAQNGETNGFPYSNLGGSP